MPIPMTAGAQDYGTPQPSQPAMAQATQNANPVGIMAQPVGVSGPTAEQTAAGITDQLKSIVQAADAIASANPQVAAIMEAIQKLAVQAHLATQQQAGGPGSAPQQQQ
jgi:hypothetical protein